MKTGRLLRKWRRLVIAGGVLLVATVVALLLPSLAAQRGVRDYVLESATQGMDVHVAVGQLRLGWFSPVEIRQIQVDKAAGGRLLEAESVRSQKTLLGLLLNRHDLGQWTVERPSVRVTTDGNSSDLEQLLAASANRRESETAPRNEASGLALPQLALRVVDGQLEVLDDNGRPRLVVKALAGELALSSGEASAAAVYLAGQAFDARQVNSREANEHGAFELRAQVPLNTASPQTVRAELRTRELSLACLEPVLERIASDLVASGKLTTAASLELKTDGSAANLQLQSLAGGGMAVIWPSRLGPDPLVVSSLTGVGQVQWESGHITLQGLRIDGGTFGVEADGQFSLDAMSQIAVGSPPIRSPANQTGRIVARIDLARAAQQMPGLLHIRQDTRIESGVVQLEVHQDELDGEPRWRGRLISSDLSAIADGRQLVWPKPIDASFDVRERAGELVFHNLLCDCQFLNVVGEGSSRRARLEATLDLDRFLAEARRFLEFEQLELHGRVRLTGAWTLDESNRFAASGTAATDGFRLVLPGGRPWDEPELRLQWLVEGGLNESYAPRHLMKAKLDLKAGDDELHAGLAEPVDWSSGALPIAGSIHGRLSRWLARAQLIAPLRQYDGDGAFRLEFAGRGNGRRVEITTARLVAERVQLRGGGLHVNEPRIEATSQALLDLESRRFEISTATLSTSAVAIRGEKLAFDLGSTPPVAQGQLACEGDLRRLTAWFRDPEKASSIHLDGRLNGRLTLSTQDGKTRAQGDATVQQLIVRQPSGQPGEWVVVWEEPELAVAGTADVEAASEQLVLRGLGLSARQSRLGCQIDGTVSDWSGELVVDVRGELDYDLAAIVERLRGLVGNDLRVVGQGKRAFQLRGPTLTLTESTAQAQAPPTALVPAALLGEATIGWESLHFQGMQAGGGQVLTRLHGGVVEVEAMDLPVNQGQVHLRPRLNLNQQPPRLSLEPGLCIEEVQISPEVCRGWLRYVAPLLADATRAEGLFSVDVQQADFPLGQPRQATTIGNLTIHGARVGPGPLAQQLLGAVEQFQGLVLQRSTNARLSGGTWISLPPQTVPVRLVDGRVHHRGLQLQVDDVVITTRGSVGLDETIALQAEIPIREEWTRSNAWLASFAGQTVRIPIRGTLSRPRIDQRFLKNLVRDSARGAAGRLLNQELGRGLQQLFGPSPNSNP